MIAMNGSKLTSLLSNTNRLTMSNKSFTLRNFWCSLWEDEFEYCDASCDDRVYWIILSEVVDKTLSLSQGKSGYDLVCLLVVDLIARVYIGLNN